jgi:hypothetical protein
MRRFSLAFLTISFCVFVSSLLVLGCGGKKNDDDEDDTPRTKKKSSAGPAVAAPTLQKVEAKEYGTLSGKVTLDGDPSGVISELDAIMKKNLTNGTDSAYCLTGKKAGDASPHPIPPSRRPSRTTASARTRVSATSSSGSSRSKGITSTSPRTRSTRSKRK